MTTFGEVAKRGRGWLPLIGLNALIGSAVTLALPTVLGRSVDSIVAGSDYSRWLIIAATLIGLGIVASIIDAFAGAACVAETTAWLRHRLVRQVVHGGPEGARGFETGDLVTRVSANANDAAQAGPAAVTALAAIAPPVGSLVLLALIDVWLAAAFFGGVVLVMLVLLAFAKRTADISLAYQETQGQIASRLAESLTGIRTIAAAGTTAREERRILGLLPELHKHGVVTWRILARSGAQAAVVGPLVLVAVLAVGGVQLVAGKITAGELFAASQYAVLGAGLGTLTGVIGEIARAKAGVQRAAEVLAIDAVPHGSMALPAGAGQLTFDHVTVVADGNVLLDDVSLDLPGGLTVAVVGPSGAGKSVLAAVAARLRDPSTGHVSLDGVPLQAVSRHALRRAVGCAFERPQLVGRTIGEAIAPEAVSPVRTLAAARATHAHDFVSRLPDGYLTSLRRAPMSGGERQRLGLARAWPAHRLLVLDDATSSLDTATERQIGRTLTEDRHHRTRLIVTHRPATAARADLVVWLDRGQVQAVAPHADLWHNTSYREVFG
ncbi:ABC transporter ATP-binding protein [Kribbella sandramycini]|uniref:ABC transporter ATP-binding protein n=1 Tax=Kribbella sandramycini TaxID=60450 RepID=A0A7Y4NZ66_9ACTN|nr:ABC transporter ATP-binding protein [Kribbella sandramycini]MBB6564999.1 ATP-binding cassette subfamily B protein [Kribbella sandramycini]NOL41271.1 ABC transporter ATP-binding protein [Kribbella sandramycini]